MELMIVVIAVGLIAIMNIIAIMRFHNMVVDVAKIILEAIFNCAHILSYQISEQVEKGEGVSSMAGKNSVETKNEDSVVKAVKAEGIKTRKETQEVKTRLTQVRKDLNVMDKKLDRLLGKKKVLTKRVK